MLSYYFLCICNVHSLLNCIKSLRNSSKGLFLQGKSGGFFLSFGAIFGQKQFNNSCKEKAGKSTPDLNAFSHHLVSLHSMPQKNYFNGFYEALKVLYLQGISEVLGWRIKCKFCSLKKASFAKISSALLLDFWLKTHFSEKINTDFTHFSEFLLCFLHIFLSFLLCFLHIFRTFTQYNLHIFRIIVVWIRMFSKLFRTPRNKQFFCKIFVSLPIGFLPKNILKK